MKFYENLENVRCALVYVEFCKFWYLFEVVGAHFIVVYVYAHWHG